MTKCSYCGAMNIEGADHCDECLTSLSEPNVRLNATNVEHSMLEDHVAMLTLRKPILADPGCTVCEALKLMVERKIGCVLVAEGEERPIGIFTERDVVRRIGANFEEHADQPIGDFMTTPPDMIDADAQIAYALQKMDFGGYRHLPVTTSGRITGVVSIRDILQYLARNLEVVEH